MSIYKRGYTLIEVLIVIMIVAVLISIVAVPFGPLRQQQALENTTNSVVAVLQDARTKTLAALNNTQYSVRIESARTVLFSGTVYSATDPTNEVYTFDTPATASTITLAGGGSQVTFDRLKGTTSQYGTIVVAIPSQTHTITIGSTGTVARN